MYIKLIILFILNSFVSVQYKQSGDSYDKVFYKKGNKITWNDFKQVGYLSDASAVTSSALSYDFIETDGKLSISTYCVLYKSESIVSKSKKTNYLLNHEQRHFDITYIYTMKFTNKVKTIQDPTEEKIKEVYDSVVKEWDDFQDKYDSETDNSQDYEAQKLWDAKIDSILSKL